MAENLDSLQELGDRLRQDTPLLMGGDTGLLLHDSFNASDFQDWSNLEQMVDQALSLSIELLALESWLTSGFIPPELAGQNSGFVASGGWDLGNDRPTNQTHTTAQQKTAFPFAKASPQLQKFLVGEVSLELEDLEKGDPSIRAISGQQPISSADVVVRRDGDAIAPRMEQTPEKNHLKSFDVALQEDTTSPKPVQTLKTNYLQSLIHENKQSSESKYISTHLESSIAPAILPRSEVSQSSTTPAILQLSDEIPLPELTNYPSAQTDQLASLIAPTVNSSPSQEGVVRTVFPQFQPIVHRDLSGDCPSALTRESTIQPSDSETLDSSPFQQSEHFPSGEVLLPQSFFTKGLRELSQLIKTDPALLLIDQSDRPDQSPDEVVQFTQGMNASADALEESLRPHLSIEEESFTRASTGSSKKGLWGLSRSLKRDRITLVMNEGDLSLPLVDQTVQPINSAAEDEQNAHIPVILPQPSSSSSLVDSLSSPNPTIRAPQEMGDGDWEIPEQNPAGVDLDQVVDALAESLYEKIAREVAREYHYFYGD